VVYVGSACLFRTILRFPEAPFRSSPTWGLANGTAWAFRNAPFVWFPRGITAGSNLNPELDWRLPRIVCRTLLIVEVYNRTNRGILVVWIFHGMMNVTGGWLRVPADMYPFMPAGNIPAAAPVVPWWHTRGRFVRVTGSWCPPVAAVAGLVWRFGPMVKGERRQ
jgi:hypothetical protein